MRSIAIEAIKTMPSNSNWTYLEHEVFGPRLSLDIPQVIFSFVSRLVARKDFALSINVNHICFQINKIEFYPIIIYKI